MKKYLPVILISCGIIILLIALVLDYRDVSAAYTKRNKEFLKSINAECVSLDEGESYMYNCTTHGQTFESCRENMIKLYCK